MQEIVSGPESVRQAYRRDELADEYVRSRYESDPFGRALHERQVRVLRRVIRRLGIRRLLEVAPGPGRLTVHVPKVARACAVEQSPAMLRVARERLLAHGRNDWELIEGDAFRLPLADSSFDMVMSFKLLRHFDEDHRRLLLAEARRVLVSEGYLVLDVANSAAYRWLHAKWGVEHGWIDDYWFTASAFRREMQDAGFKAVWMRPVHTAVIAQHYCWAYLHRLSAPAARLAGRMLQHSPFGQPLEWLAVCQCA